MITNAYIMSMLEIVLMIMLLSLMLMSMSYIG